MERRRGGRASDGIRSARPGGWGTGKRFVTDESGSRRNRRSRDGSRSENDFRRGGFARGEKGRGRGTDFRRGGFARSPKGLRSGNGPLGRDFPGGKGAGAGGEQPPVSGNFRNGGRGAAGKGQRAHPGGRGRDRLCDPDEPADFRRPAAGRLAGMPAGRRVQLCRVRGGGGQNPPLRLCLDGRKHRPGGRARDRLGGAFRRSGRGGGNHRTVSGGNGAGHERPSAEQPAAPPAGELPDDGKGHPAPVSGGSAQHPRGPGRRRADPLEPAGKGPEPGGGKRPRTVRGQDLPDPGAGKPRKPGRGGGGRSPAGDSRVSGGQRPGKDGRMASADRSGRICRRAAVRPGGRLLPERLPDDRFPQRKLGQKRCGRNPGGRGLCLWPEDRGNDPEGMAGGPGGAGFHGGF